MLSQRVNSTRSLGHTTKLLKTNGFCLLVGFLFIIIIILLLISIIICDLVEELGTVPNAGTSPRGFLSGRAGCRRCARCALSLAARRSGAARIGRERAGARAGGGGG